MQEVGEDQREELCTIWKEGATRPLVRRIFPPESQNKLENIWEGLVDAILTTKEAEVSSHFCLLILGNALRRPVILNSDAMERVWNESTEKSKGAGTFNTQG